MKLARKFIASVVTGAMLISNVSAATSVIADQTESTETEVVITETTESKRYFFSTVLLLDTIILEIYGTINNNQVLN